MEASQIKVSTVDNPIFYKDAEGDKIIIVALPEHTKTEYAIALVQFDSHWEGFSVLTSSVVDSWKEPVEPTIYSFTEEKLALRLEQWGIEPSAAKRLAKNIFITETREEDLKKKDSRNE